MTREQSIKVVLIDFIAQAAKAVTVGDLDEADIHLSDARGVLEELRRQEGAVV